MKNQCLMNCFTAIVLGTVLFITNSFGANPSDAQATQPAATKSAYTLSWTWNKPGQLNGWVAGRTNSCEVSSNGIEINTGNDFNIVSPPLNINAEKYRYIVLRLKCDLSNAGEIFFMPEDQKGFSQQFSVLFQIIGDNEFHTYLVDMTKNIKWQGQIHRLRLDTENIPGINIQIGQIELLKKPDPKETYTILKVHRPFDRSAGPSSVIRINNEEQFFNALNLDLPGMEGVKAVVTAKDWPAAKKALLEYMRNRTQPRYIVDRHEREKYVEKVKKEFSAAEINGLLEKANLICEHDFTLEGCRRKFDGPVIWDMIKSGAPFAYNCWLNRMLYLNDLGQAYWLTGDNKYAKGACELVSSWINSCPMPSEIKRLWEYDKNPPSDMCRMSNPWGQTLEVAQRLNSWTAFNEYFVDSPDVTSEFYYRFLVSLLEQTRYMYVIENLGFCGGNWPIVECGGLAQAAIMFPEFKESPKWLAKVMQLTKMQMHVTVFPDGVQVERSPGYHTWCYEQFNNLRLLGTLNNIELPEGFAKTVRGMYEYRHYKIAYPDKSGQPGMADGSGALWGKNIAKGSLNSQGLKNLWKLGIAEYDALKKSEKSTLPYTSTELTSAGFYVMRSGWGDKDRFLLFDCATPSTSGGHWHNSALNVDIYAFGRPLIVDTGSFGYSVYSHLDYVSRVRAHNIIEFHSEENRQDPKLIRWLRSKDFCLVEGMVDGPHNASMTRRVLFVGGDYWIVDDTAALSLLLRVPVITRAYWHLNSDSVVVDGQQVHLVKEGKGAQKLSWSGEDGQDLSFYTNDSDTGNILVAPDSALKYSALTMDSIRPVRDMSHVISRFRHRRQSWFFSIRRCYIRLKVRNGRMLHLKMA